MESEGISEYPLLIYSQIKGLAVGLVRRYPLQGDVFDNCNIANLEE